MHPQPRMLGANNTVSPTELEDEAEPLSSLDLSTLSLSPREVAHAFHLPLSTVISPLRMHHYLFRGDRPYYAIDVSDIIRARFQDPASSNVVSSTDSDSSLVSDSQGRDEVGGGQEGTEGRLEAWGLTGWYLTTLFRRLGVYDCKE